MPTFSPLSEQRLATCHSDLQRVFREVVKIVDCSILCGHRGEEEQDAAYHDGRSKKRWPQSAHNTTPSTALDAAPFPINWEDREAFFFLAGVALTVAYSMGIRLVWGGRWKSLQDLPHFQLAPGGEA